MRKFYFIIALLLALLIGAIPCQGEENNIYAANTAILDENNNILNSIDEIGFGSELIVSTKIVNPSGEAHSIGIFLAYYDEDILMKCRYYKKEILADTLETDLKYSFDWDDTILSDNASISVYIFAENIMPLCNKLTLEHNKISGFFLSEELYSQDFEGDIEPEYLGKNCEIVTDDAGYHMLKINGAESVVQTSPILKDSDNVLIQADFKQLKCTGARTGVISMGRYNYSGKESDRLCYVDVMAQDDGNVNKNCFAFATSYNSYMANYFDYKLFSPATEIYDKNSRSTEWFKMTMCYADENVFCYADTKDGDRIWSANQKSNSDKYLFDDMKNKSAGIVFATHSSDVVIDNIKAYKVINIDNIKINIPQKMHIGEWYDFDVTATDEKQEVYAIDYERIGFIYNKEDLIINDGKIKLLKEGSSCVRVILNDVITGAEHMTGKLLYGISNVEDLRVYSDKESYFKNESVHINVTAENNGEVFQPANYELYCDGAICNDSILTNLSAGDHTIKARYGDAEAIVNIYVSIYEKADCVLSDTAPIQGRPVTFELNGYSDSHIVSIEDYSVSYDKNAMQIENDTITFLKSGVHTIIFNFDSVQAQFEIECGIKEGVISGEDFENPTDKNGYIKYNEDDIISENGNRVLRIENNSTEVFGSMNWKNYTVSGRFKIDKDSYDENTYVSGFEIVTRSVTPDVFGANHRNVRFIYNKSENRDYMRIGTIYGGEVESSGDEWHTFTVSLYDNTAIFKVDNNEMMSRVSNITAGGFYFLANNCTVMIDDLEFYINTSGSKNIEVYTPKETLNPYEVYRIDDIAALRIGDSNCFVNSLKITWTVDDNSGAKIEDNILSFSDDISTDKITVYAAYQNVIYPIVFSLSRPNCSKQEYAESTVNIRQESLAYRLSEACDALDVDFSKEVLSYMPVTYAKMLLYPKLVDYSSALKWHVNEAQYQDVVIGRGSGGADFVMMQMMISYLELNDKLCASDEAWDFVKEYLTSIDYAVEGANYSENHMIVNYAIAILCSETWMDSEICGMPAEEAHRIFKQYFKNWYNNHISDGMMEYNSAHYYFVDLFALETLYTYSKDDEIRKLSYNMANYIYADGLDNNIGDDFGGAQFRAYVYDKITSRFKPYKIAFNIGNNVIDDKYEYLNIQITHALTSTFRPIKLLYDEALDSKRTYSNIETNVIYHLPYNIPYEAYLTRYTHVTPNYVIGSKINTTTKDADGITIYNGYQEIPWSVRFGDNSSKMIFGGIPAEDEADSHFYWTDDSGEDKYKLMQHENTLIGMYENDDFPFVHFRIPKSEFKLIEEIDGWIFINNGKSYMAFKAMKDGINDNSQAYEWSTSKEISRGRKLSESEIKINSKHVVFVCEVADEDEYSGDFDGFKVDIMTKTVINYTLETQQNVLEYIGLNGNSIKIDYINNIKYINEEEYEADNTILHDSPYIQAKMHEGHIKLRYDEREYIIEKVK